MTDLVAAAVLAHLRRPLPGLLVLLALIEDLQLFGLDEVGALPLLGQPQRIIVPVLVNVIIDQILHLDLRQLLQRTWRVRVLGLFDDRSRDLQGVFLLFDYPKQAGLRFKVVGGYCAAEF